MHGFGGGVEAWSSAADATDNGAVGFPARQAMSSRLTYGNFSLDHAQHDLRATIDDLSGNSDDEYRNFIIGHSQGGIVGRALVSKDNCEFGIDNLNYGGLVTFGSALKGAQLMNSRDDGLFEDLATSTCETFTLPFFDIINDPLAQSLLEELDGILGYHAAADGLLNIQGLTPSTIINAVDRFVVFLELNFEISNTICPIITENFVVTKFGKLSAKIGSDYRVGSSIVTQNNSCLATNIEKIAFYGTEPYTALPDVDFVNPIFYRVVQHFITDVNSHPNWGANNDSHLASKAAKVQAMFLAKSLEYKATANALADQGYGDCTWWQANVWHPFKCKKYDTSTKLAQAHYEAYEWFENINDIWLGMIGAVVNTTNAVTNPGSCKCYMEGEGPGVNLVLPNVSSQTECSNNEGGIFTLCLWTPPVTQIQTTTSFKPSDGVVLAESAMHMTGAQYDPKILDNTSHMQMRNNEALRDALLDLYNNPGFFNTDPK